MLFYLNFFILIIFAKTQLHKIDVTGKSAIMISPDEATITFHIVKNSTNAGKAWSKMVNFTDKVKQKLLLQQIEEKDISIYSVELKQQDPTYRIDITTRMYEFVQLNGYEAKNIISVKVRNLTQVQNILNTIVAAKVNQIKELSFGISPEVSNKFQKQLLQEAVQDAKLEATLILEAINQKIVSVISIDQHYYNTYTPSYKKLAPVRMGMGMDPPTSNNIFNPEDEELSVSVRVLFEIANNDLGCEI